MTNTKPPRAEHGSFDHIQEIYYGTDDGFAELSPREEPRHDAEHVAGLYEVFARFERFHREVEPSRRQNVHLASVVGGLYGLNLIPIFQPNEITFFDVNPYQIAFFEIIRRVWIDSRSADQFLGKLADADYEASSQEQQAIRTCIAARQNGTLLEQQGRSAHTFLSSWRYALDHFVQTRRILEEASVNTRLASVQSKDFHDFVATRQNLWLFLSNVLWFVFFDLQFDRPQNAALFATYFDKTEMLDLGGVEGGPVTVHCRVPMSIGGRATK